MAKLIIVVGMPGSGKTAYLGRIKESGEISEFYDDFQGHSYDREKDPRLSKYFTPMLARLKKDETVAASDIRYCIRGELNKFVAAVLDVEPEVELEFRYFENNPQACAENVKKRARTEEIERELKLIEEYTKQYSPLQIKHLPVYR